MGLFQRALETYDANLDRVGVYDSEETEPLAPICHIIAKAQIEITLDQNGNFISATAVEKNNEKTIIPATEASAGRSGINAFMRPHPLCDKLSYLAAEENYYLPQLEAWANSIFTNPKLSAVLNYVKKQSILKDLEALNPKEDTFIRWRVVGLDTDSGPCWKDQKLFQSFIQYQEEIQTGVCAFCMVTGNNERVALQHAKGVVSLYGNAKLISSNDESGFTYRGRFTDELQAASVSFTASQKTHNALRWLIANQGTRGVFGGRTFLCWNPQGIRIANPTQAFLGKGAEVQKKPSDYREQLNATLKSYRKELQLRGNEIAVLAAFDAATTGRLSLTYYDEFSIQTFLACLCEWDKHCCWWNGRFGIQAPSIVELVNCAYGTQRTEKGKLRLATDDRVMKQALQALLVCRLGEGAFPLNIHTALNQRAGSPQAYDPSLWENILYCACAAIQMTIYQTRGEDAMSWELNKPDRSFQFGRLLAVMDRAEADYYWQTGEKGRQTNALKMMSVFRQRPWAVYEQVNRQLNAAYLPRIKPWQRSRYQRLTGEIVSILSCFPESELNRPLSELYLMGYDLQRKAFFTSDTEMEETENE